MTILEQGNSQNENIQKSLEKQSEYKDKNSNEPTKIVPEKEVTNINFDGQENKNSPLKIKSDEAITQNQAILEEDYEQININNFENYMNPDYYDEFGRPKYDEIIKFQNELVAEVEHTSPLVSEKMSIDYLVSEFKDSQFLNSLNEITQKYDHIRTVRRDGNCFYRSFMFRLFEQLSQNKQYKLYNQVVKIIEDSKDLIIRNGTQWFVLEDFYNIFLSEWKFVNELDPLNTTEYMYLILFISVSYCFKIRRSAIT
jgi:hypothetical protein